MENGAKSLAVLTVKSARFCAIRHRLIDVAIKIAKTTHVVLLKPITDNRGMRVSQAMVLATAP